MFKSILLNTNKNGLFNVTEMVRETLKESNITDGMLLVSVPHSSAAITVVSPWDELGLEDVHDELSRLIPTRIDFKHQYDTPQDAAGHIKSGVIGHSAMFYIHEGKLGLGGSQGIFFWEFDAPRKRSVQIKIIRNAG